MSSNSNQSNRIAELEAEVQRLKAENADLREENDLLIAERDAYNEGDYIEAVDAHQRLFTLDLEQIRKAKDETIEDLQKKLDEVNKNLKFTLSKYKEAKYALDVIDRFTEAINTSCQKVLSAGYNYWKHNYSNNSFYSGHFGRYIANGFVALMNVNIININTLHTIYKNKKNNGRPYRIKKAMWDCNRHLEGFMKNEDDRVRKCIDYYKIKAGTNEYYNLMEGKSHNCKNLDKAYIMYSDYESIDNILQEFYDRLFDERLTYSCEYEMKTNMARFNYFNRLFESEKYFNTSCLIPEYSCDPKKCKEIMDEWIGGDFKFSIHQ